MQDPLPQPPQYDGANRKKHTNLNGENIFSFGVPPSSTNSVDHDYEEDDFHPFVPDVVDHVTHNRVFLPPPDAIGRDQERCLKEERVYWPADRQCHRYAGISVQVSRM